MNSHPAYSTLILVQARMGSERLPAKVMERVQGKPLLGLLIERLKRCKSAAQVVIATTTHSRDDVIEQLCQQEHVPCFRGSEEDVLDRMYRAAKEHRADAVVRICGDCPLIDPAIIDQMIEIYRENSDHCDYVCNILERTYPRGMDAEVMSFAALETAHQEAKQPEEREHVTPFIYRHPERFRIQHLKYPKDNTRYRWVVDTADDLKLMKRILEEILPTHPKFTLEDLLELLKQHPEWEAINAHVEQRKI